LLRRKRVTLRELLVQQRSSQATQSCSPEKKLRTHQEGEQSIQAGGYTKITTHKLFVLDLLRQPVALAAKLQSVS